MKIDAKRYEDEESGVYHIVDITDDSGARHIYLLPELIVDLETIQDIVKDAQNGGSAYAGLCHAPFIHDIYAQAARKHDIDGLPCLGAINAGDNYLPHDVWHKYTKAVGTCSYQFFDEHPDKMVIIAKHQTYAIQNPKSPAKLKRAMIMAMKSLNGSYVAEVKKSRFPGVATTPTALWILDRLYPYGMMKYATWKKRILENKKEGNSIPLIINQAEIKQVEGSAAITKADFRFKHRILQCRVYLETSEIINEQSITIRDPEGILTGFNDLDTLCRHAILRGRQIKSEGKQRGYAAYYLVERENQPLPEYIEAAYLDPEDAEYETERLLSQFSGVTRIAGILLNKLEPSERISRLSDIVRTKKAEAFLDAFRQRKIRFVFSRGMLDADGEIAPNVRWNNGIFYLRGIAESIICQLVTEAKGKRLGAIIDMPEMEDVIITDAWRTDAIAGTPASLALKVESAKY